MSLTVTFPGKYGDSLWALPTVRAIAEATGEPVHFLTSPHYASHLPLIAEQSYIASAKAWPSWQPQDTAPMTPWSPFEETLHHKATDILGCDAVYHLGYREWPTAPLAQYVYKLTQQSYPSLKLAPLDLDRAWIQTSVKIHLSPRFRFAVGFSDEYFELKFGIVKLLELAGLDGYWIGAASRWVHEAFQPQVDWQTAASVLQQLPVCLTCNSSLHVLACACGTKQIVMLEPNEHRYNDVFFPYGKTGREILVLGGDGLPTFDARHCRDVLKSVLQMRGAAV